MVRPPSLDRSGTFSLFDLELDVSKDGGLAGPPPSVSGSSAGHLAQLKAGAGIDRSLSDLELYRELMLSQTNGKVSTLQMLDKILGLCRPQTELETLVVEQLRQLRQRKTGNTDIEDLATDLLGRGFLVQIRDGANSSEGHNSNGQGGAPGARNAPPRNCLRTLRHRFLVCTGYHAVAHPEPVMLREPLVVEPRFKEQFLIANPTDDYDQLVKVLPVSFVGTINRLVEVVGIMAQQVAAAFKQQRLPLPPWRSQEAMLSKWSPQQIMELAKLMQRTADCAAKTGGKVAAAESNPGLNSLVRGLSRQMSISMGGGGHSMPNSSGLGDEAAGIAQAQSIAAAAAGLAALPGFGAVTAFAQQLALHTQASQQQQQQQRLGTSRIGQIAVAAGEAGFMSCMDARPRITPLQLPQTGQQPEQPVLLSPFLSAAAQTQAGRMSDNGKCSTPEQSRPASSNTTPAAAAAMPRQRSNLNLHRGDKAAEQPCVIEPVTLPGMPVDGSAAVQASDATVVVGLAPGAVATTAAASGAQQAPVAAANPMTSPLKFTRQSSIDLIQQVKKERGRMRSALAAALRSPDLQGGGTHDAGPVTDPTNGMSLKQPVSGPSISCTGAPPSEVPGTMHPRFGGLGLNRKSAPEIPAEYAAAVRAAGAVAGAYGLCPVPNLRVISDTNPALPPAVAPAAAERGVVQPPQQAQQQRPPAPAKVKVVATESQGWPGWPRILTVKWGAAMTGGTSSSQQGAAAAAAPAGPAGGYAPLAAGAGAPAAGAGAAAAQPLKGPSPPAKGKIAAALGALITH